MTNKLLIGFILLIVLSSCSLDARISKADKKFALGEYYKSAEMYRAIYPSVSPRKQKIKRAEVAFKMGNSYRLIESNKRAEAALKNAIRYKYKDSIVYYYYAEVLRSNKKYALALKNYQLYQKSYPNSALAAAGIVSCDSALKAIDNNQLKYIVERPKVFNSRYSDFCPVFASSQGDFIYFNSTRGGKKSKVSKITGQRNNDIYTSRLNIKGEWEEPQLIEGEINSEFDEGACSFSSDGQELLYTVSEVVKGETLGTAIFSSMRSGGEWSEPKKLEVLKDSSLNVAHPALSPDGAYLYFVSDMPGTLGGKDIFRAKRDGQTFGEPENLGPEINTEADEMFPYFRENGLLYFSSDGHPGLGGLDIYSAQLTTAADKKEVWVVNHLPAPINSNSDDFGICFEGNKDKGYFSSNRGNKKYYDHIFSFEKPILSYSIKGSITDSKGDKLTEASVKIIGNDGSINKVRTGKDGKFIYEANKGVKYLLLATCRGFLNLKAEVDIDDIEKSQEKVSDFKLSSITKPVKMNNIFFVFGSHELSPESTDGLNDLVKLLNDNPNITIEVSAHTDCVGNEDANIKLSQMRAQSVIDYLTAHGVASDRLTAKGYGESVPVYVDRELATKYRFLKMRSTLTEEYISKLTTEQQEIANQINRRTEFKVLKTTYKMY